MQLHTSLVAGNAESMCMLQCHCIAVTQHDLQFSVTARHYRTAFVRCQSSTTLRVVLGAGVYLV